MANRNPLTVSCPNCQAVPCEACTQPTSTSRKPVDWYHSAREAEANIRETEYNEYASKVRLHSTWVPPFSEWLGMRMHELQRGEL